MNALLILTILAVASPIFGEEGVEVKKQEKRGVIGLGYGGHGLGYGGNYLGGLGYGYNGLGHGYTASPYYSHGYNSHVAPALSHSTYASPLVLPHNTLGLSSLSHGYSGYNHGYQAPIYSAPHRYSYTGLGHGYNAAHAW